MAFGIVPKDLMTDPGISMQAKALYALLATYANPRGEARVSRDRIANELGKSPRMVSSYCAELERSGYLSRSIRDGLVTEYRLLEHVNTLAMLRKGRGQTLAKDDKGGGGTLATGDKGTLEADRKGAKGRKGTLARDDKGTLANARNQNNTWENKEEKSVSDAPAREGTTDPEKPDPQPPPEVPKKKPRRKKKARASAEAEEIYDAYPRKDAREKSLASIEKALEHEEEGGGREVAHQRLLEATRAWAEHWRIRVEEADTDNELDYCPYAATWFNQKRYDDDRSRWKTEEGQKRRLAGNGGGAPRQPDKRTGGAHSKRSEYQRRSEVAGGGVGLGKVVGFVEKYYGTGDDGAADREDASTGALGAGSGA